MICCMAGAEYAWQDQLLGPPTPGTPQPPFHSPRRKSFNPHMGWDLWSWPQSPRLDPFDLQPLLIHYSPLLAIFKGIPWEDHGEFTKYTAFPKFFHPVFPSSGLIEIIHGIPTRSLNGSHWVNEPGLDASLHQTWLFEAPGDPKKVIQGTRNDVLYSHMM